MADDRHNLIHANPEGAPALHGAPSSFSQSAGWHSRWAWLLFVAAIVLSFFVHELSHCAVSWVHGYRAIPTPAKEYVLESIPERVQNQVALGGLAGSVVALLIAMVWLHFRTGPTASAVLAGAMTAPGFYTLRFILAGRGHDATEFQEAQAALGLTYSGHSADWLFVSLFVAATLFWFVRTKTRLNLRLFGRFALGALVAMVTVVLLQSVNNAVFDPVFEPKGKPHGLTMLYEIDRISRTHGKTEAVGFS